MKVSSQVTEFQKFTLCLEIETKEETEQIFCLFNHSTILDTLKITYGEDVRNLLVRYNPHIKYQELFKRLDKILKDLK